jgi:hypothetical protein
LRTLDNSIVRHSDIPLKTQKRECGLFDYRKGKIQVSPETTKQKPEKKEKLSVLISYNGMNESFDYNPQQTAHSVRVHALNHYDIRGAEREQNFLFGPDNQTEISDDASIGPQVQPGSQLYLRPRTAGGGRS